MIEYQRCSPVSRRRLMGMRASKELRKMMIKVWCKQMGKCTYGRKIICDKYPFEEI